MVDGGEGLSMDEGKGAVFFPILSKEIGSVQGLGGGGVPCVLVPLYKGWHWQYS